MHEEIRNEPRYAAAICACTDHTNGCVCRPYLDAFPPLQVSGAAGEVQSKASEAGEKVKDTADQVL